MYLSIRLGNIIYVVCNITCNTANEHTAKRTENKLHLCRKLSATACPTASGSKSNIVIMLASSFSLAVCMCRHVNKHAIVVHDTSCHWKSLMARHLPHHAASSMHVYAILHGKVSSALCNHKPPCGMSKLPCGILKVTCSCLSASRRLQNLAFRRQLKFGLVALHAILHWEGHFKVHIEGQACLCTAKGDPAVRCSCFYMLPLPACGTVTMIKATLAVRSASGCSGRLCFL